MCNFRKEPCDRRWGVHHRGTEDTGRSWSQHSRRQRHTSGRPLYYYIDWRLTHTSGRPQYYYTDWRLTHTSGRPQYYHPLIFTNMVLYFLPWTMQKFSSQSLMNHGQQVVHNWANCMHIHQNTLSARYCGNLVGSIVYRNFQRDLTAWIGWQRSHHYHPRPNRQKHCFYKS